MIRTGLGAAILWAAGAACAAQASNLVWQPYNPSFGGSPLNGGWMLQQGTAQNTYTREKQLSSSIASSILAQQQRQTTISPVSNFAAIINSRLLAAVADRITNAIFGENAQPSGVFVVEGTTISFQRVNGNVQITVNDGTSSTTVTVPLGF